MTASMTPPRSDVRLGPYAGLDHRFVVEVDDPALADHVRWAFATLEVAGAADEAGTYRITRGEPDGARYSLRWDDEIVTGDASTSRLMSTLMWHVNQQTIRAGARDHVLLHAAAVARDGRALVLPAAMESGKTTLAAGLIDRGWSYLTDEAAAVCLDGRRVRAYPKPLSIDPGSQRVLAHWAPTLVDDSLARLRRGQWQVPATARDGGHVVHEAELAAVVLPRYAAGADTALTRVSRAAALARAGECTFMWQGDGLRDRFAALAAAVRRSACAELVVGDLDEACRAIERLWEANP